MVLLGYFWGDVYDVEDSPHMQGVWPLDQEAEAIAAMRRRFLEEGGKHSDVYVLKASFGLDTVRDAELIWETGNCCQERAM